MADPEGDAQGVRPQELKFCLHGVLTKIGVSNWAPTLWEILVSSLIMHNNLKMSKCEEIDFSGSLAK